MWGLPTKNREAAKLWADHEKGRLRYTYIGSTRGPDERLVDRPTEVVMDGQYVMIAEHNEKTVRFGKMSDFQRRVRARMSLDGLLKQLFVADPDPLQGFKRIGQDSIGGKTFDIWAGEVSSTSPARARVKVTGWLAAKTSDLARLEVHVLEKEGDWPPVDGLEIETVERNVSLAADMCFTLNDGSVIAGWRREGREGDASWSALFEDLRVGGPLPELPLEPYALKPFGGDADVTYIGHHLAYTTREGRYCEWAIYVPDKEPPKRNSMLGYTVLFRYNPNELSQQLRKSLPGK